MWLLSHDILKDMGKNTLRIVCDIFKIKIKNTEKRKYCGFFLSDCSLPNTYIFFSVWKLKAMPTMIGRTIAHPKLGLITLYAE
jgi:hypothetical protein